MTPSYSVNATILRVQPVRIHLLKAKKVPTIGKYWPQVVENITKASITPLQFTFVFTKASRLCHTPYVEVTKIQFEGFDWDQGNILKAQKHGVRLGVIESLFESSILVLKDPKHSSHEERWISVGTTAENRTLFVAFTYRSVVRELKIRVISARYAHKKESDAYEKLKKNIQKNNIK